MAAALDISYLTAAAHQVGYAVGGGFAGLLTATLSRRVPGAAGSPAGWCSRVRPASLSASAPPLS